MRADLAPFVVDLLLALAGFGVLLAIGIVPQRGTEMLAALGLAYLAGAAVVPIVLILLLVIGIPFTLATFAVVVLACVAAGLVGTWRRGVEPPPPSDAWWRRSWRQWPRETWVVIAFLVLFGLFALAGLISASQMSLTEWDAWSIWARKAQMLTGHDSLVGEFWTSDSYSWIHLDYPIQYPVWEALHSRAGGSFQTQDLLRHVWLLLVAFVWAAAYLLRDRVRPVVWAPLLLLAAAAPGIWQQLLTGYADVPMGMYVCLGALLLGFWLRDGDGRLLALAAVMLAAAANLKNEGLLAAGALLVVAGVIVFARRLAWRQYAFAVAAVVAAILPWRIWTAAQGIEGDLPVGKTITDPGYLFDRIDRVWPAFEAICRELADQGRWLQLLPLAALMVTASLISGVGRRAAAFYLASFALLWAGLVWSYWISPNPLAWHLATSASRVITVLVFVCLAAALHLAGLFLAELGRRRGTSSA